MKNEYNEYNYERYKSIREIENYLVELEKGGKKEQEKEDIIYKLSNELIGMDVRLSGYVLCGACPVEHLVNKLCNLLNNLNDGNDLIVRITNLSNELHETLKIIENCTNCKDKIRIHYPDYSYEIYESIREIENYLVELERGEKKEQEKEDIIYKLSN